LVGGAGAIKVNDDTYSEPFVVMNADRIMQRIRDLFKVQHFYARRILLQHLQGHPREQVDVALTRMITDQTEHILDKYGRTGRLVNVGEYYLFQPSEITNPRIGIYERSAPLQFKRDHISFSLTDATLGQLAEKHGFAKPKAMAMPMPMPVKAAAMPASAVASAAMPASAVASAVASAAPQIQEMKAAYREIMAGASNPVDKNTKTWNDLCRDVMRELAPIVDVNTLKKCVVHHFLEELLVSSYEISLQYLNALFAHAPADEFDRVAREYFESQILKNSKYKGEEGILMLNVQAKTGM
jgi:hypothetical protein